jgi:hypothetical protein
MYDGLRNILAAWREILHISAWTGLSLGALAGLAALFYFVPLARKLAVAGAITVLVGWFGLIHGDAVGRADVQMQWNDAKAAALKAQTERDDQVEQSLKAKYEPKLAELQQQSDAHKARGDSYEQKLQHLAAQKRPSPAAGASCQLGAAADRVPKRK